MKYTYYVTKTNWIILVPISQRPGEGNGNPLQYSCLEDPMGGGAWWAAVYRVSQSRTQLKRLSSSSSSNIPLYICTTASFSIHLLINI